MNHADWRPKWLITSIRTTLVNEPIYDSIPLYIKADHVRKQT